MRPIPEKLKEEIANDPFMQVCCITRSLGVSWEHCWIYAGKQINERWAIVPLRGDLNTSHPPGDVKERCQLISLNRAKELGEWENLKKKYPRHNWEQIYKYLSRKYDTDNRV